MRIRQRWGSERFRRKPSERRETGQTAALPPCETGHCKEDHRMGRNFLAHRESDSITAVLAAGHNFRRVALFLRLVMQAFLVEPAS
jgi:transposase, IS5 family